MVKPFFKSRSRSDKPRLSRRLAVDWFLGTTLMLCLRLRDLAFAPNSDSLIVANLGCLIAVWYRLEDGKLLTLLCRGVAEDAEMCRICLLACKCFGRVDLGDSALGGESSWWPAHTSFSVFHEIVYQRRPELRKTSNGVNRNRPTTQGNTYEQLYHPWMFPWQQLLDLTKYRICMLAFLQRKIQKFLAAAMSLLMNWHVLTSECCWCRNSHGALMQHGVNGSSPLLSIDGSGWKTTIYVWFHLPIFAGTFRPTQNQQNKINQKILLVARRSSKRCSRFSNVATFLCDAPQHRGYQCGHVTRRTYTGSCLTPCADLLLQIRLWITLTSAQV